MSYLLDTNVLSELRKGESAHPAVREWWSGTEEWDLHLGVMVLGEVRRGIDRLRARNAEIAYRLEN